MKSRNAHVSTERKNEARESRLVGLLTRLTALCIIVREESGAAGEERDEMRLRARTHQSVVGGWCAAAAAVQGRADDTHT